MTDAERALTVGMARAEALVVLLRRNEHRRLAQAWEHGVTPSSRLIDLIAAVRAEAERRGGGGLPEVPMDSSQAA